MTKVLPLSVTRLAWGLACVLLSTAGFFAFVWTSGQGQSSELPGIIVTTSQESEKYAPWINDLRDAGFTTVDSWDAAMRAIAEEDTAVFMVTRDAYPDVPPSAWRDLYAEGVLIGGLDVSLHDLQPVATGRKAGMGRLEFNPGRPIFSLLAQHEGCFFSAFSDWADNYDVSEFVEARLNGLKSLPSGIICAEPISPHE